MMKYIIAFIASFAMSLILLGAPFQGAHAAECIIAAGGSGTEGAPKTMHCDNCDKDVTICLGDFEYCHYTGAWPCPGLE